jgi:hypothetical protein
VDDVLADSTGGDFQKAIFLGDLEEDAFTLGEPVRDASAAYALPGGRAATEAFNVFAERAFFRRHASWRSPDRSAP